MVGLVQRRDRLPTARATSRSLTNRRTPNDEALEARRAGARLSVRVGRAPAAPLQG